jgi:flagellum-specific peptidoglycan hydrolase FlgJ
MTRMEYIVRYGPHVVEQLKGTKLFPSVMMAQAILESADKKGVPGGSLLASKYNNHFGIKAGNAWVGEKVLLMTKEFVNGAMKSVLDWFRVYTTAFDSFDDRIHFLLNNLRYTKGGVFEAKDFAAQAQALQRSGYATDPMYASKLTKLIKTLRLDTIDELGVPGINLISLASKGDQSR